MNFLWNTVAVGTGFVAGVIWYAWKNLCEGPIRETKGDTVSFEEYDRVIKQRQSLGASNYEMSEQLYALELLADGYAASKSTVLKKVARDLYAVLDEGNGGN